jgi:hypothetical protein
MNSQDDQSFPVVEEDQLDGLPSSDLKNHIFPVHEAETETTIRIKEGIILAFLSMPETDRNQGISLQDIYERLPTGSNTSVSEFAYQLNHDIQHRFMVIDEVVYLLEHRVHSQPVSTLESSDGERYEKEMKAIGTARAPAYVKAGIVSESDSSEPIYQAVSENQNHKEDVGEKEDDDTASVSKLLSAGNELELAHEYFKSMRRYLRRDGIPLTNLRRTLLIRSTDAAFARILENDELRRFKIRNGNVFWKDRKVNPPTADPSVSDDTYLNLLFRELVNFPNKRIAFKDLKKMIKEKFGTKIRSSTIEESVRNDNRFLVTGGQLYGEKLYLECNSLLLWLLERSEENISEALSVALSETYNPFGDDFTYSMPNSDDDQETVVALEYSNVHNAGAEWKLEVKNAELPTEIDRNAVPEASESVVPITDLVGKLKSVLGQPKRKHGRKWKSTKNIPVRVQSEKILANDSASIASILSDETPEEHIEWNPSIFTLTTKCSNDPQPIPQDDENASVDSEFQLPSETNQPSHLIETFSEDHQKIDDGISVSHPFVSDNEDGVKLAAQYFDSMEEHLRNRGIPLTKLRETLLMRASDEEFLRILENDNRRRFRITDGLVFWYTDEFYARYCDAMILELTSSQYEQYDKLLFHDMNTLILKQLGMEFFPDNFVLNLKKDDRFILTLKNSDGKLYIEYEPSLILNPVSEMSQPLLADYQFETICDQTPEERKKTNQNELKNGSIGVEPVGRYVKPANSDFAEDLTDYQIQRINDKIFDYLAAKAERKKAKIGIKIKKLKSSLSTISSWKSSQVSAVVQKDKLRRFVLVSDKVYVRLNYQYSAEEEYYRDILYFQLRGGSKPVPLDRFLRNSIKCGSNDPHLSTVLRCSIDEDTRFLLNLRKGQTVVQLSSLSTKEKNVSVGKINVREEVDSNERKPAKVTEVPLPITDRGLQESVAFPKDSLQSSPDLPKMTIYGENEQYRVPRPEKTIEWNPSIFTLTTDDTKHGYHSIPKVVVDEVHPLEDRNSLPPITANLKVEEKEEELPKGCNDCEIPFDGYKGVVSPIIESINCSVDHDPMIHSEKAFMNKDLLSEGAVSISHLVGKLRSTDFCPRNIAETDLRIRKMDTKSEKIENRECHTVFPLLQSLSSEEDSRNDEGERKLKQQENLKRNVETLHSLIFDYLLTLPEKEQKKGISHTLIHSAIPQLSDFTEREVKSLLKSECCRRFVYLNGLVYIRPHYRVASEKDYYRDVVYFFLVSKGVTRQMDTCRGIVRGYVPCPNEKLSAELGAVLATDSCNRFFVRTVKSGGEIVGVRPLQVHTPFRASDEPIYEPPRKESLDETIQDYLLSVLEKRRPEDGITTKELKAMHPEISHWKQKRFHGIINSNLFRPFILMTGKLFLRANYKSLSEEGYYRDLLYFQLLRRAVKPRSLEKCSEILWEYKFNQEFITGLSNDNRFLTTTVRGITMVQLSAVNGTLSTMEKNTVFTEEMEEIEEESDKREICGKPQETVVSSDDDEDSLSLASDIKTFQKESETDGDVSTAMKSNTTLRHLAMSSSGHESSVNDLVQKLQFSNYNPKDQSISVPSVSKTTAKEKNRRQIENNRVLTHPTPKQQSNPISKEVKNAYSLFVSENQGLSQHYPVQSDLIPFGQIIHENYDDEFMNFDNVKPREPLYINGMNDDNSSLKALFIEDEENTISTTFYKLLHCFEQRSSVVDSRIQGSSFLVVDESPLRFLQEYSLLFPFQYDRNDVDVLICPRFFEEKESVYSSYCVQVRPLLIPWYSLVSSGSPEKLIELLNLQQSARDLYEILFFFSKQTDLLSYEEFLEAIETENIHLSKRVLKLLDLVVLESISNRERFPDEYHKFMESPEDFELFSSERKLHVVDLGDARHELVDDLQGIWTFLISSFIQPRNSTQESKKGILFRNITFESSHIALPHSINPIETITKGIVSLSLLHSLLRRNDLMIFIQQQQQHSQIIRSASPTSLSFLSPSWIEIWDCIFLSPSCATIVETMECLVGSGVSKSSSSSCQELSRTISSFPAGDRLMYFPQGRKYHSTKQPLNWGLNSSDLKNFYHLTWEDA